MSMCKWTRATTWKIRPISLQYVHESRESEKKRHTFPLESYSSKSRIIGIVRDGNASARQKVTHIVAMKLKFKKKSCNRISQFDSRWRNTNAYLWVHQMAQTRVSFWIECAHIWLNWLFVLLLLLLLSFPNLRDHLNDPIDERKKKTRKKTDLYQCFRHYSFCLNEFGMRTLRVCGQERVLLVRCSAQ